MKKVFAIISVLVLALTLSACSGETVEDGTSYLAVDINPSIEFVVNEDDQIESYTLLNEDAEIVAADLDFEGMAYEDALDLYLDAAIETGYLDVNSEDNAVFITTDGEDEAFEENVNTEVRNHLEERGVGAAVMAGGMDDIYHTLAEEHSIGVGRARLLSRAVEIDGDITFEEALEMDMGDIMAILVSDHHNQMQSFKNNRQQTREAMKSALEDEVRSEVEARNQAVEEGNAPEVDIDGLTQDFQENKEARMSEYQSRRKNMKDHMDIPVS